MGDDPSTVSANANIQEAIQKSLPANSALTKTLKDSDAQIR